MTSAAGVPEKDRQQRILDAVITLLSQRGIAGVSMRAVAREAGVALGLVNYYFEDKKNLISAALRRVEDDDVALLAQDLSTSPEQRLRAALHRVAAPEFLTTEYLSLRLQLWSLAQVEDEFAQINASAQYRYRAELAKLIHAARPALSSTECERRAVDIDVIQNGLWLTVLLGLDPASTQRTVTRCEEIALAS